jgi:DNA replication protein DnaC
MRNKKRCEECSALIEPMRIKFDGKDIDMTPQICDECKTEKSRKEDLKQMRRRREGCLKAFFASVPVRYRDTDTDHPEFNRRLHEFLSAWKADSKYPFITIQGESGLSKTRCAFLRGQEFAAAGESVHFVRGSDFSKAIQNRFGENGARYSRQLDSIRESRVLIFDDLGKVSATKAVAAALFDLVDERYSRNLATIWTMNLPIAETFSQFPKEYADPAGGRILEASTNISL